MTRHEKLVRDLIPERLTELGVRTGCERSGTMSSR
jgi:hypothetical protein